MWSYVAYGLRIQSSFPLPELLPATGEWSAQVVIRVGTIDPLPPLPADRIGLYAATADAARLVYPGTGSFLVREGREIIVDPADGVRDEVVRLSLLGPALGALLHQRGYLTLHASAVAIHGRAIVFLGQRGWGKSTTAAALHARGYPVVADDIVAIQMEEDSPVVFPGFPRLKLWPEALSALGEDAQALSRLHPELEKRDRPVFDGFRPARLPLGRLYVLADSAEPAVETLQPQEGFVELVRHSYASRLLQAAGSTAVHLRQCGILVARVPVRRLRRSRSLVELPALARLVEDDLDLQALYAGENECSDHT